MTADHGEGNPLTTPPGWADWRRWVPAPDADWSDWRSWLHRIAAPGWASAPGPEASPDQAAPWPGVPWDQVADAREIPLTIRAFREDEPGDRTGERLAAAWPAFRRWWREGAGIRPTAGQARVRLEEHMPELVPTWRRLAAMLDGEPTQRPL